MRNHRFGVIVSNVILGVLVVIGSGIIWFATYAYGEILSIQESLSVTQAKVHHLEQQAARVQQK